ncbi:hypothetical protein QTP70_013049 [Hemibagrus guttatus]|uniref:Uncharacterized protein n=1 Tax=Hemibagrus guttatus TaxID=175788 RepID=A0AAE0R356_9TELE|nr:hypothetical protein QTP70_013049 [Hemibagrus guttatus]
MAVVINPGLDRSSMKFRVLTIRIVKFVNVLRRMPFLTQPSLFIRAWDRHRSHWTVTPMARFSCVVIVCSCVVIMCSCVVVSIMCSCSVYIVCSCVVVSIVCSIVCSC